MLIQRDATRDTPGLMDLRSTLNGKDARFVERRPSRDAIGGACYWNVRDRVLAEGGGILFGWMVIELPELALMAWHHAVWSRPDGGHLDLSPHPLTGTAPGTTAFIEDATQDHDLDWPPAMGQVFQPLADDPRVSSFVAAYRALFRIQREHLQAQQSVAGTSYDHVTATVRVPNAVAQARLEDLARTYGPLVRAADERRARFLGPLAVVQRERRRMG